MNTAVRHGLVGVAGAVLVLGALLVGCGKWGPARLPIRGTVLAANGKKFSGSITFVPTEGTPGPAATANLIVGDYRFDRENGPTVGPHRVIVTKLVAKDMALKSRPHANPPASAEDAVAEAARTVWTLSADVSADPPYQCNFKLAP